MSKLLFSGHIITKGMGKRVETLIAAHLVFLCHPNIYIYIYIYIYRYNIASLYVVKYSVKSRAVQTHFKKSRFFKNPKDLKSGNFRFFIFQVKILTFSKQKICKFIWICWSCYYFVMFTIASVWDNLLALVFFESSVPHRRTLKT